MLAPIHHMTYRLLLNLMSCLKCDYFFSLRTQRYYGRHNFHKNL